jgi:hypothetical protein
VAENERTYTIGDVARELGMRQQLIRAYYLNGVFPLPHRDVGNTEGGFWLERDVETMRRRRLEMHRYRLHPAQKQAIKDYLAGKGKKERKRPAE